MNKISILTLDCYGAQIRPMRERLGECLCRCYWMATPSQKRDNMDEKLVLSSIPFFIVKGVELLTKFHLVPKYYMYFYKMLAMDYLFAKSVANDDSRIVYANPFFYRTIFMSKKKGKTVVVFAGNSEPEREYQRIVKEYKFYNIHHQYIYGDRRFKDRVKQSYVLADSVISISQVSWETYERAHYDMRKFRLIPLTGTDFKVRPYDYFEGKSRAFISTAFHNFIKGTHRLLLAWQQAQIKDIPLIIVGRVCEDLQEFVKKYGPFENVIFVGHQKVEDFYSTRDAVGVLLSLSEGAGRVTPELMSFGFPMITSPDATCDLVEDGINGFVVSPYDIEMIAEKLKYFADDWKRVYEFRANVLNTVKKRTVKQYAEEVSDYLLSL